MRRRMEMSTTRTMRNTAKKKRKKKRKRTGLERK